MRPIGSWHGVPNGDVEGAMGRPSIWRTLVTAFTVATIVYAIRTRLPTVQRVRERFWNPDDPRVFTPHIFGVGWSVNLYQVVRRLRELRSLEEPADPQT